MTKKDKFLALVTEQDDSVLEQINWRMENRTWLNRSKAIAVRILTRIDELNISQKELAKNMSVSPQQVNKWLKGTENFTIETISKLEDALHIELINVVNYKADAIHEI